MERSAILAIWIASLILAAPIYSSPADAADTKNLVSNIVKEKFDQKAFLRSIEAFLGYDDNDGIWKIPHTLIGVLDAYEVTQDETLLRASAAAAVIIIDQSDLYAEKENGTKGRMDEIRNRVMPGWGTRRRKHANYRQAHSAHSAYGGLALARFARIASRSPHKNEHQLAISKSLEHIKAIIHAYEPEAKKSNRNGIAIVRYVYPKVYEKINCINNPKFLGANSSLGEYCRKMKKSSGEPLALNIQALWAMLFMEFGLLKGAAKPYKRAERLISYITLHIESATADSRKRYLKWPYIENGRREDFGHSNTVVELLARAAKFKSDFGPDYYPFPRKGSPFSRLANTFSSWFYHSPGCVKKGIQANPSGIVTIDCSAGTLKKIQGYAYLARLKPKILCDKLKDFADNAGARLHLRTLVRLATYCGYRPM